MQKYLFVLFVLCTIFASCKTSKKIVSNTHNQVDSSAQVDSSTQNIITNNSIDHFTKGIELLDSLRSGIRPYTFFYGKLKLDFKTADESSQGTIYIRIKKDSLIWVSLSGPLGFEGLRMMIRPDTLLIMNHMDKTILLRPISYIEETFHIPIDYFAIQDLMIGNAIFNDSMISNEYPENGLTILKLQDHRFQNKVFVQSNPLSILQNILYEGIDSSSRNAVFTYSHYEDFMGYPFSTERTILIQDKSAIQIELNFKQYSFNKPQTFPFNIPKNYSKK
ncbi:MAG: DUF4292 domain-containing protein [Bacteroidetes bacterium]|nr:DUF4292 domain-containing protein [Bacteroidota bacterium]